MGCVGDQVCCVTCVDGTGSVGSGAETAAGGAAVRADSSSPSFRSNCWVRWRSSSSSRLRDSMLLEAWFWARVRQGASNARAQATRQSRRGSFQEPWVCVVLIHQALSQILSSGTCGGCYSRPANPVPSSQACEILPGPAGGRKTPAALLRPRRKRAVGPAPRVFATLAKAARTPLRKARRPHEAPPRRARRPPPEADRAEIPFVALPRRAAGSRRAGAWPNQARAKCVAARWEWPQSQLHPRHRTCQPTADATEALIGRKLSRGLCVKAEDRGRTVAKRKSRSPAAWQISAPFCASRISLLSVSASPSSRQTAPKPPPLAAGH